MDTTAITQMYERTLEIPPVKPQKQIIVCPIGVVGSGKTTVVKPLAKHLSLLRISPDEIRKILKGAGQSYASVKEIVYHLVEKYTRRGYSIAIDGDCNSPESRHAIRTLQTKYDVQVYYIHINPPEEFIIHKLKNYPHSWLFRDAHEALENYHSSKQSHATIDFDFVYTFDTSRGNLEQQIREAISKIKSS